MPPRAANRRVTTTRVSTPVYERINRWAAARPLWIAGALVTLWLVVRMAQFNAVAGSTLYQLYQWKESDSAFFDEQARHLAAGDWLNRQPMHPYHGWHQAFADYYFKQHPDALSRIQSANPSRDTAFVPGKALWNEWYGGNTFHQEPLYAYMLAVLYRLTGNGVYWMLVAQILAGILSGLLLWQITRRYFDHLVALIAGLLYACCGIALFQEALILRTSWSVLFALATVYALQRALDRQTKSAFFISGLSIGLAGLLQAQFYLLLPGALALYARQEHKLSKPVLRNAGLLLAGFALISAPLVWRNAAVGAPLFSSSSIATITFVATNVQHTNAVSGWQPDAAGCAEIMGQSGGRFIPAASLAIQTHSLGSYLQLIWSKFKSAVDGQEWPNNENYYFYRETVPVVRLAGIDGYWIIWSGIAGLLFTLYDRKRLAPLYLALSVQLAALLVFYVLGRLRLPLAMLLLPFSAYCLAECFRFAQTTWKVRLAKLGVAALCFLLFSCPFCRQRTDMLDRTDYNVLYELAYYDRIKQNAEAKQYQAAIALHAEFLRYQPDFIANLKPNQVIASPSAVELVDYFANHHQIHSYLYEDSGNKDLAGREQAKFEMMKRVAQRSRDRVGK